jgi:hypothetical protein
MDDNREVRRGLLMTGLWVLGVTVSVALAFAAVGRVASRVAPPGVARLSASAVDRALSATVPSTPSPTLHKPTASSTPPSTRRASTTTRPAPPSSPVTVAPPPTLLGPASSVAPPTTPRTTEAPPPTTPQNTATTSQGGTVWTRCSGADHIVYVAAVPRSGFERTHDVEGPGGIVQWFQSNNHVSKINAQCSNGVVHAEVEEEREGGDYTPYTSAESLDQSS